MKKFTPFRLLAAKDNVVKHHTKSIEVPPIKPNDDLKSFIMRIVKLPNDSIKSYAVAMDEIEVLRVAAYIPHDYYDVKMDNLFLIVNERSTEEVCNTIIREWHNSYENEKCRLFLLDLVKADSNMKKAINKCHLLPNEFTELLSNENIPRSIGLMCLKGDFTPDYTLGMKINYYGIETGSKLYHDIEFLFYTFCDKADYFKTGDELLTVVKIYKNDVFKDFLVNFLNKLSLEDLDKFEKIGRYLNTNLGDIESTKCKDHFNGLPTKIWEKYRNWMIRLFLNDVFGHDERSVFWRRYKFSKKPKKHLRTKCIIMEWEAYYGIEFLGDVMGAWYFCEKESYGAKLKRYLDRSANKTELVHSLYQDYKNGVNGVDKRNHPVGWESEFAWVLSRRHITERISI